MSAAQQNQSETFVLAAVAAVVVGGLFGGRGGIGNSINARRLCLLDTNVLQGPDLLGTEELYQ